MDIKSTMVITVDEYDELLEIKRKYEEMIKIGEDTWHKHLATMKLYTRD